MTIHDTLVRPLVTEKGISAKDDNRTLCFQVAKDANKIMVKQAVEKLFNVRWKKSGPRLSKASCAAAEDSPVTARTGRKPT